jgi:hypothetical protein
MSTISDDKDLMLTGPRWALLRAIAAGVRLKDHRDLEGHKTFVLHTPDQPDIPVEATDVEALVEAGLISSNKKFPAATYWLTDQGRVLNRLNQPEV